MPQKTDPLAYALHTVELFARVDQQDLPVTAIVRKPFECVDSRWLCVATISGLIHRKADLEKSTAEESIKAAQSFVLDELNGLVAGGGKLYKTNRKPVTDLRALFRN